MQGTQLQIVALAHGGEGVGRPVEEGRTWFVPGVLPGERVLAEAEHEAKRFIRGHVLKILEPSVNRVEPGCDVAGRCGGCNWQHVGADVQPSLKADIVRDQLRQVIDPTRVNVAFKGEALGYRRRARLHFERAGDTFHLGFFGKRSRSVVDQARCPVLSPRLVEALAKVRTIAHLLPPEGEVFGLCNDEAAVLGFPSVRESDELVAALTGLLDDNLVGIELRGARQRKVLGRKWLEIDKANGLPPMRISAFGFSQAQEAGNHALVVHVARMARTRDLRVLELYAGAGNFTRALARSATRVWASDNDREGVDALLGLAKATGLSINAKCQNAPSLLKGLAEKSVRYDVVVLDPPSGGVGEQAMAAACKIAIERIVYVSCDPATLARDLKIAVKNGFELADVSVFDLMPMTSEIETVATLHRRA